MVEVKLAVSNADLVRQATDEAIKAALEDVGEQARDYAVSKCPVGQTGNLRNSIKSEVEGNTVAVGSAVYYAPYVELGHHTPKGNFVDPRPFIKPAIQNHIDEYRMMIEEMLKNGV